MASSGLYLGKVDFLQGGSNLPVNINSGAGVALTETMGALNVNVSNPVGSEIPVSDTVLDACITEDKVAVNVEVIVPIQIQASVDTTPTNLSASVQGSYTSLDVSSLVKVSGFVNEALPFIADVIKTDAYISLGVVNKKQICLFGKVVDWKAYTDGTVANLYIFYANADGSLIYQSSLGAIAFTKVASPSTYQYDFSRDWCSSVSRVYLMCDKTIDIDIGYSVSS